MCPGKRAPARPHNDAPRQKGDLPPPSDKSGTSDELPTRPLCPAESVRWSEQVLICLSSCSSPGRTVHHRPQMYPLLEED